ncbi:hypothetical protein Mlaev_02435 [Microbacterium laevaniformans]|jgi:hypothetical protein|uniref:Uncharacterized protein n=1 Tax=Microbacterium laevaniformans TaxID=36807 RepID=A0A150H9G1_9MICO|nr:hypothetical protein [Microbacterium laevaniformans]KXZ58732.1 hypothetical protein Mlaev_02435 [Microbacterium laevaniformans]
MVERRKPGTRPRGARVSINVRVPLDHHAVYTRHAEELGIPLGSWVALQLADAQNLPVPAYIEEELRRAQARRDAEDSRQELPMPRTA